MIRKRPISLYTFLLACLLTTAQLVAEYNEFFEEPVLKAYEIAQIETGAMTEKTFQETRKQYKFQRASEDYSLHTKDPASVQKKVLDFFRLYYLEGHQLARDKQLMMAIRKDNCNDPAYLTEYAYISYRVHRYGDFMKSYNYANKMMSPQRSAHWKLWLNHLRFMKAENQNEKKVASQLGLKAMMTMAVQLKQKKKITPMERRFLWFDCEYLFNLGATQYTSQDIKSLLNLKGADPWFKHMLIAKNALYLAQKYQNEEFYKRAYLHAEAAWELHKDHPESIGLILMMTPFIEGRFDESARWFDQAVAVQFDWKPAYDHLFYYMKPRKFGNYASMVHLAIQCKQTKRYDTEIPMRMYEIFKFIQKELDENTISGKVIWREPFYYRHATEMLEQQLTWRHKHIPGGNHDSILTALAALKYQNGEKQAARKYIMQLKRFIDKDELIALHMDQTPLLALRSQK